MITAPDSFSAAEGILVTLGTATPWLFIGTALTVAIALGRGYRPKMPRSAMTRRPTTMSRLTIMRRPAEMPVIGRLIEVALDLFEVVRSLLVSRSRKDRWSRRR